MLVEESSVSPESVGSSVTLKLVIVSSNEDPPTLASGGGSHFSSRSR